MQKLRPTLACLALVSVVVAPMAVAGPATKPFQATIAVTEQFFEPPETFPAECDFGVVLSGKGVATGIGVVSVSSVDCAVAREDGYLAFQSLGAITVKAENGDQVFARYSGLISPAGAINGSYFILGGTGRFAKATGSGSLNGSETINAETGTATGQIKLNGTMGF